MLIFQSAVGLIALMGLAWAFGENRRRVNVKTAFIGVTLQLALAIAMLKLTLFKDFFIVLNKAVLALESSTRAGTSFV